VLVVPSTTGIVVVFLLGQTEAAVTTPNFTTTKIQMPTLTPVVITEIHRQRYLVFKRTNLG